MANLVQVKVFSGRYESSGLRDGSDPTRAPATIHKDFRISSATAGGSDTQPTITVNRKTLGEVDITPAKVPAGSVTNFKIAYKLTEDMDDNDVIEINLPPYLATSPASWTAPSISVRKPKSPPKTSHVYLSGTVTRLEPTIRVIDGGDVEAVDGDTTPAKGWIVQIALGTGKTMSKGGTITLHYDRAVVQRALATNDPAKTVEPKKLVIKTFSGDESVNGVPQYPAAEMIKDTIEVTVAADGSGMVMFEHDGNDVTTMKGTMKSQEDGEEDTEEDTYVTFVSNTDVSIPAGLDADDLRQLVVEYVPAGNMGTAGEFEVRLPSGWSAVDSLVSGGEKDSDKSHPTNSDDTVVVDLYDNFGETSTDRVYITFTDITVPNKHGEVEFTAKSKSGGTRTQLESRATAFVGNAEAMYDTVGVKITPDAAYENEERVNFVIELTNTGPLHDSEIQITVPEGLSGLSNDPKNASNDNFVKMVSTTARSVRLSTLDIIDEDIIVKTGKLNAAGKIVIHFNNVDIGDITETDDANGENADTGFRVYTRTRVPNAVAEEDQDFASFEDPIEVAYERIQKADGKRGIMGGLIRIVNGSGSLAVKPRVVEQNSQNQTITLTYTAATDIKEKDLVIQLPSVIETIGGVSPARKETSGRTLTWEKRTISEGHSFIVTITGVDFLGYTGDFRWITTLGGTQLLDTDNPPMVVVGTTKTDVAFEIVENGGVAFLDPSYPAASEQSIRFQFTAENTAIQPGGKLRFKVPGGGWTAPSITDRAGKATVGIITLDDDEEEILVDQLPADTGSKMMLKVSNRDVTLDIGADGFARGDSVIIQYGTADFPVEIPANKVGTPGNLEDGLAIHGSYLVSGPVSGKTFRMHSAGVLRIDVTNVDDGTGEANVTPPSVRASSTNNLMRIVYTGAGTMDGGAVQLTIPNGWGDAQRSDNAAANYMNVTVGTGAVLKDFEVHDSGRTVEANLTTFGFGDTVMFTYGGTGAKGAEAPAEIGDSTFMVEAKGSSNWYL